VSESGRADGEAIASIRAHAGGGPRPTAQLADVLVDRAAGAELHIPSGVRLIDAISGYGVASLGHSHPRWVQAVTEQAARLVTTSLYTPQLADYLVALSGVLPPALKRIALTTTGAEAVELALRLVQTERGRSGVLTFSRGFHGKTVGVRYAGDATTAEARELAPAWLHVAPFPACELHDALDYHRCDEDVDAAIAETAAIGDAAGVGAVLVEPVLGTAGNIPPRRPFLAALRKLCDERGWLLVFDESITGFGRTGTLFAFEAFGAEPDVLVLSKGLGGGFPLSAVCAARELWDRSALNAPSGTSSTFGGNPLACAAGLATLEIVTEPGFLEQVRLTGAHAARRLRELADGSARVARPRGLGLMLGFNIVDPASGRLASRTACEAVFRACRDRGALVAANAPSVRLSPPLTLSIAETDRLFDILSEVLA
jgi:4-aminobutyrate aminotransferase-like enzyme